MLDSQGRVVGHFAVIHDQVLADGERALVNDRPIATALALAPAHPVISMLQGGAH